MKKQAKFNAVVKIMTSVMTDMSSKLFEEHEWDNDNRSIIVVRGKKFSEEEVDILSVLGFKPASDEANTYFWE